MDKTGRKRRIYQDLAIQVERGYRGWVVAFSLGGRRMMPLIVSMLVQQQPAYKMMAARIKYNAVVL